MQDGDTQALGGVLVGKKILGVNIDPRKAGSIDLTLDGGEVVIFTIDGGPVSHWILVRKAGGERIATT